MDIYRVLFSEGTPLDPSARVKQLRGSLRDAGVDDQADVVVELRLLCPEELSEEAQESCAVEPVDVDSDTMMLYNRVIHLQTLLEQTCECLRLSRDVAQAEAAYSRALDVLLLGFGDASEEGDDGCEACTHAEYVASSRKWHLQGIGERVFVSEGTRCIFCGRQMPRMDASGPS